MRASTMRSAAPLILSNATYARRRKRRRPSSRPSPPDLPLTIRRNMTSIQDHHSKVREGIFFGTSRLYGTCNALVFVGKEPPETRPRHNRPRDFQATRNVVLTGRRRGEEGERPLARQRRIPGTWLSSKGLRASTSSLARDRPRFAQPARSIKSAATGSTPTSATSRATRHPRPTMDPRRSGERRRLFFRARAARLKPCFPNPFPQITEPAKESFSCPSRRQCRFKFGSFPLCRLRYGTA